MSSELASTSRRFSRSTAPSADTNWRAAGLRYYAYNFYLRNKFGHRVQRVSVDAGFTCPNVDGTVAIGGCTFCDNRSFSPSRRVPRQAITAQIDDGIRRLKLRYRCDHFMAYFQPATNTYAPVERLRPLYETALAHPQVVAIAIGTRPDCVPDDVLDLLGELGQRTYLSVEYGMQTRHDWSLDAMNRGHHHVDLLDAVERSVGRGFEICVHVILGLPGETHADMMATADEVARLPIHAVKIHNLYAVRGTVLAEQVERGETVLMEQDAYVSAVRRLPRADAARDDRRAGQRRSTSRLLGGARLVPRQDRAATSTDGRVRTAGQLAGQALRANGTAVLGRTP